MTTWSDVAELVKVYPEQDSQGYGVQPEKREIMCHFVDGVSQNEFYRSYKAGLQASATLTLWSVDYEGERYVEFNDKRYSVIRSFVPEEDLTTLVLSEVIR